MKLPERELLILTAMQIEAKIVRRALRGVQLPAGMQLRFLTIGISACRLPEGFCQPNTAAIIVAGFAGALRPDLELGEIIYDTHPADFASHLPLRRAKIHTADQLIATAKDKADLHRQSGACAVEMEFSLVQKKLGRNDVPLIHVRSISDSAEDEVDEILMDWIDPLGQPRLGAIARSVLANPRRIKILAKLRSAIKAASPSLGEAVRQFVDALVSERSVDLKPRMDTNGYE